MAKKVSSPAFLQQLLFFVINVLNNKTIVLLSLAEYPLISSDEAVNIRRYSPRFHSIIVNGLLHVKDFNRFGLKTGMNV